MKIAYLMLFHKDPGLLKRAIRTLSVEGSGVFVHIDRKSDINAFRNIASDQTLFCEPRVPVYWAEFSQIEATRLLIRKALASSARYSYFILIQGSTYPLRSGRYIQRFFERNQGAEFMNLVKMPAPGYPLSKVNILRYPSDRPVLRFAARALARVGLAQRDCTRYLRDLAPYSGHACWALSRDACEYLTAFDASNPYVAEYFKNVFVPEESFFHTILGNSPLRDRIRRNLVYADWSRSDGHHPADLNGEHVKFFETYDEVWIDDEWGSGEALLARKFSDDDMQLVERVDTMIAHKEELGLDQK